MGCVGTINRHQLGNRVRVLSTSKIIPAEYISRRNVAPNSEKFPERWKGEARVRKRKAIKLQFSLVNA